MKPDPDRWTTPSLPGRPLTPGRVGTTWRTAAPADGPRTDSEHPGPSANWRWVVAADAVNERVRWRIESGLPPKPRLVVWAVCTVIAPVSARAGTTSWSVVPSAATAVGVTTTVRSFPALSRLGRITI